MSEKEKEEIVEETCEEKTPNKEPEKKTTTQSSKGKPQSKTTPAKKTSTQKATKKPASKGNAKVEKESNAKKLIPIIGGIVGLLAIVIIVVVVISTRCKHEWVLDDAKTTLVTCKADGTNVYKCSKCEKEKTEVVKSTGVEHKAKADEKYAKENADLEASKKCTESYEVFGTCEYCSGKVVLETKTKPDHVFADVKDEIAVVTLSDGKTIDPANHMVVTGKKCTVCGDYSADSTKTSVAHDHTASRKPDNTKLAQGYCYYYEDTCSCGYTYVTSVKHAYGEGVTVAQTCTTDGSITYECKNEGCLNKVKVDKLEKLGHSFNEPQTCIDRVCKTCNETVPASTTHAFADNATCHDRTCPDCGYVSLTSTNHTPNATHKNCSACGFSLDLAKPELSIENELVSSSVTPVAGAPVYYLDGAEFNGSLVGISDGIHTVTAKNIDPSGIFNTSAEASITVWSVAENPIGATKTVKSNIFYIQLSQKATPPTGMKFTVRIDIYKDGKIISTKTSDLTATNPIAVSTADCKNPDKAVVTLIVPDGTNAEYAKIQAVEVALAA